MMVRNAHNQIVCLIVALCTIAANTLAQDLHSDDYELVDMLHSIDLGYFPAGVTQPGTHQSETAVRPLPPATVRRANYSSRALSRGLQRYSMALPCEPAINVRAVSDEAILTERAPPFVPSLLCHDKTMVNEDPPTPTPGPRTWTW